MKILPLVFVLSFAVSCGFFKRKEIKEGKETPKIDLLLAKYEDMKLDLIERSDPVSGWPSAKDCDGTLWAGIASAGGVKSVKMSLAELEPGKIIRRPIANGPCWSEELGDTGAKSTVSNDMITGYMLSAWRARDLAALQRLASYGESRNWIMGEPASMASRVVLRPNGIGLLGRLIYSLSGGKDKKKYRDLPSLYSAAGADFERHLAAIGIVLQGEVEATMRLQGFSIVPENITVMNINESMFKVLRSLVKIEPQNPLFHAALAVYTGDNEKAIDLILDDATPIPSYVRGEKPENFWLAQKIFAADLVIRHYKQ